MRPVCFRSSVLESPAVPTEQAVIDTPRTDFIDQMFEALVCWHGRQERDRVD